MSEHLLIRCGYCGGSLEKSKKASAIEYRCPYCERINYVPPSFDFYKDFYAKALDDVNKNMNYAMELARKEDQIKKALEDNDLEKAFIRFKKLAEKKGAINEHDLRAIVTDELRDVEEYYVLEEYKVKSGSGITASSSVRIRAEGREKKASAKGDGPIDASFRAIDSITGLETKLVEYNIEAVSEGKDAIGQVKIIVSVADNEVMGSGISTDVVEASIKAYIDAANRIKAFI